MVFSIRHFLPRSATGIAMLFWMLATLSAIPLSAREGWQKSGIRANPVICRVSGESGHGYVPPPGEFLNRLKSATKTSDIVVTYVGFPDSVKTAFEMAVGIWESLLSSSVPIYMLAEWKVLDSETLGSCGAQYYYANFDNAPFPDTYYPVALAEKIMEREITGPGNHDMKASFNSSLPWYFGTDGKTPSSRYDFVSTVLHEIANGLGFIGFFKVAASGSIGYYDHYGDYFPAVFDRWVEDFNRNRLTNPLVFDNPSSELYNSFTSNALFSGSPVAFSWGSLNRPRLFAPAGFLKSSSIYHLNDYTYPYGSINALMTHAAGKGEAIHTPGPLASGILADIGWKHLYFRFSPLKDVEEFVKPLDFSVVIESDLGVDKKKVRVIWSSDQFASHRDTLTLMPDGNRFYTSFNPPESVKKISYYLEAADTLRRTFTFPVDRDEQVFSLYIGKDTVKPVILHEPVKYLLSENAEFEIEADITDNLKIDTVQLFLYVNGTPLPAVGIEKQTGNLFRKHFTYAALGARPGDSISYVIQAVDAARSPNMQKLPENGRFSFRVEEYGQPVKQYAHNFDAATDDFILADFKIVTWKGFENGALHSPHPYLSPDRDDASLEFFTILRNPVIVSENTRMSFDEVVLVEPGEPGVSFGSEDFFDYVIVEGSRDFGENWLPLLNGYDSGSKQVWLTSYNTGIKDGNSIVSGTKELFFNREFTLTQNKNFKAGDTLLIRFRIWSDPYAHGWGWVIDNLRIEPAVTSAPVTRQTTEAISIFPNPFGQELWFILGSAEPLRDVDVEIADLTGRIHHRERFDTVLPRSRVAIGVPPLPAGMYILRLNSRGIPLNQKKIIRKASR